jgi:hypothetical protein
MKFKTSFDTDGLSSFVKESKPKTYKVEFNKELTTIIVFHINNLSLSHKSRIINKYNLEQCKSNGIPYEFIKVDFIE